MELYGKSEQTRFIPVLFEKDNDGQPFLPVFLKSRLYIDLCGDSEAEYNRLRDLILEPFTPKQQIESNKMIITGTNGNETEVEVITTFFNKDETKQYIMYTKMKRLQRIIQLFIPQL